MHIYTYNMCLVIFFCSYTIHTSWFFFCFGWWSHRCSCTTHALLGICFRDKTNPGMHFWKKTYPVMHLENKNHCACIKHASRKKNIKKSSTSARAGSHESIFFKKNINKKHYQNENKARVSHSNSHVCWHCSSKLSSKKN